MAGLAVFGRGDHPLCAQSAGLVDEAYVVARLREGKGREDHCYLQVLFPEN